jgi:hypothetical protein
VANLGLPLSPSEHFKVDNHSPDTITEGRKEANLILPN